MTILVALVAFAVAVIAISPSPDSLLVLRTATVAGPTKAFAAAAGVCAGLLCLRPGGSVRDFGHLNRINIALSLPEMGCRST
jgi:hypothetical protein